MPDASQTFSLLPLRGPAQPCRPYVVALAEIIAYREAHKLPLPHGFSRVNGKLFHEVECDECHGDGYYEVQVSETEYRERICIECEGFKTVSREIEEYEFENPDGSWSKALELGEVQ